MKNTDGSVNWWQLGTAALSLLSAIVSGIVAYQMQQIDVLRTKVTALEVAIAARTTVIESNGELLRKIDIKLDAMAAISNSMDKRLVTIEASRFTAKDGLDIWQEINKIRAELPAMFPPDEWRQRIIRLEETLRKP